MVKIELLVVITFAVFVCSNEVEDVEQKKRGAGKTSLNSIPTGVQKPEYTYSIYSQNPSVSNNSPSSYQSSNPSYQAQVPNSFYPSQNAQYYTPNNSPSDASYQQPPQINLIPPTTSSQFVPLNFIPNNGYQAKYQLVPSKTSNGNIQLAILQQPTSFPSPALLQYPQSLLSPNSHQIHPQQNPFGSISPHSHFNIAGGYQPLSLGNPYLGQQSTMLLLSQPNPSLYNNLLYPNPVQSFYNYYPSNSQAKYSVAYGAPSQSSEYDKLQGPITQSLPKEDSDVVQASEYSSDVNTNYKNAYATNRASSYSKLK
ncbi:uncharacterized protein ACR2FA_003956 [Aphomia sociella]